MLTQDEKDTLAYCLDNTLKIHGVANSQKVWYTNFDVMFSVAAILDGENCFPDTGTVIRFFEKPYKFETDMQELLDEDN